jgi:hypothetical protein
MKIIFNRVGIGKQELRVLAFEKNATDIKSDDYRGLIIADDNYKGYCTAWSAFDNEITKPLQQYQNLETAITEQKKKGIVLTVTQPWMDENGKYKMSAKQVAEFLGITRQAVHHSRRNNGTHDELACSRGIS